MKVDVVIIGGGIAGLSCAAFLDPAMDTVLLEAEATLGYHATGRSAALYTECYGNATISKLTQASSRYFAEHELTTCRGLLFVAKPNDEPALDDLAIEYEPAVPDLLRMTPHAVEEMCPLFPAALVSGGLYEAGAKDIDVDALQTSFVRAARNLGVSILTTAPVHGLEFTGDLWRITTDDGEYTTPIVVNAAGAWGDRIASMGGVEPLGLRPLLRSVFTFDPGSDPQPWPMVVDAHENWYLKPTGPLLLGSAASELPSEPRDARADELDIALGIEKVSAATAAPIRSIKNTWAGLRTFAPDRTPAVGYDPHHRGFFWLVGQGGYGIMTSPALGALAASLIADSMPPAALTEIGFTPSELDPARLRSHQGLDSP
ncbi:MAG: FAD-binding oxidoreductase [Acidimicrobiia bacterium]